MPKTILDMKPCPFCGNTDESELSVLYTSADPAYRHFEHFNVVCSCGGQGPDADTREQAIEKYNRRNDV